MSKDWHAEIQRGLDAIKAEGEHGTAFALWLIPCHSWDEMKTKAAEGDSEARTAVVSILEWLDMITMANRTDAVLPHCACCDREMRPGGIAGWTIFVPKEKEKTGMVGGFCTLCYHGGPDSVMQAAISHMMEQMGAHPMTLH